jgi:hypothetical protein
VSLGCDSQWLRMRVVLELCLLVWKVFGWLLGLGVMLLVAVEALDICSLKWFGWLSMAGLHYSIGTIARNRLPSTML